MTKRAITQYTYLFFLTLLLISIPLLITGKVFVYSGDGTSQHIPFMGYYAKWLRQAVSTLLRREEVVAYAHSMGYGSDILSALNWYGMGDPINLLYGLLPAKYILLSYSTINVLRLYLSGYAMILLIGRFNKVSRSTGIAGICYAFSGFAFTLGLMRHPFFINPLIQLPLLLIGIDKILKHQSPVLFILSVTWTALCGYYFLYMCSIFLFMFALIRHFYLEKTTSLSVLSNNIGRSILYLLIGLCLAAPVFVPSCIGFLTGGRSGEVLKVPPFAGVSIKYYLNLPNVLLSDLGRGTSQPAIIWLGFAIAVFRRDKTRNMRLTLVGCALLMILLPITDNLMNGFSYATSRWTFGLSTLIVFIGASGLQYLSNLSAKQKRTVDVISLLSVLYFGYLFASKIIKNRSHITLDVLESAAYPGFVAAEYFVSWMVINLIHRPKFQMKHKTKLTAVRLLTVALMSNVVMTGYLWLIPRVITETYTTPDRLLEDVYESSPLNNALLTQPGTYVRIDADPEAFTHKNDSITTGVSSTIFYNSTLPAVLCESVSQMNLPIYMSNYLYGLNARAALESLWSVSHFVRKSEAAYSYPIPYGFELIANDGAYELYKNKHALPFGYTISSYVTETEFKAACSAEKQWMLLQGATLPKKDDRFDHITPVYDLNRPEFDLSCSEGIEWKDGQLIAEKNGWIRLQFNGSRNSETYLKLTGLRFTRYKGNKVEWEVSSSAASYSVFFSTPAHNQHAPQEDFLIQLGYSDSSQHMVTITFNQAFEAEVNSIGLVCQPMDALEQYLENLQFEPMEDVIFEANRISGKCTVTKNSILVLSMPFSNGWRALIDGKPTEVFASGTAFTAMKLSAGTHRIELSYHTPGASAGRIAFAFGVVSLFLTIRHRRNRMKRNNNTA